MLPYARMKTTIEIDDDLARRTRQLAAREGKTLRQLLDEALRARVLAPPRPRAPFRLQLPTVRGRRPPAVDVADRDALYDLMERE